MHDSKHQDATSSSSAYLRVKAMLPRSLGSCCPGRIVEGIIGPVHEGVLTEHGSHDGIASWSKLGDAVG